MRGWDFAMLAQVCIFWATIPVYIIAWFLGSLYRAFKMRFKNTFKF